MTTRLRNVSFVVFLLTVLAIVQVDANPFENYCNTVSSQCYGYRIDFSECTASLSEEEEASIEAMQVGFFRANNWFIRCQPPFLLRRPR